MYFNVTESFNAWIKEARHLLVCNMVDSIRFKLMNMMCDRQQHCHKWETHLCLDIHKMIEDTVEESRCLLIGHSNRVQFEVIDNQSNLVNLHDGTCSCKRCKVYGLQCKHACAGIMQTDTNVHWFGDDYYIIGMYNIVYGNLIYPIPDHDKLMDNYKDLRLRPPITRRRPGRPRRRRIESQTFNKWKLHYSRCNEVGHN
ncbi:uncharacterized protein LOC120282754 [Dioscorea cayenensis subsp. rotundata]|uniref:Uncharacterized protein LOC120282754 n=1 Tax=Dioscorea cayennensis subsp. rotundata TaxID=55577 RepID=A0AB40D1K1_DIOCR|nr:uncharacterized protein LOC120282754 [Dioscorea cayenensis subsp. rotundata]